MRALTKDHISVVLADDGTMALSSKLLGNKYDNYVKAFEFLHMTAHLQDFKTFILFKKENIVYSVQCNIHSRCWIPTEVTTDPGEWKVMMVAYMGDNYADPDYFFTSNVVKTEVTDNFLNNRLFGIETGTGSGGDVQGEYYSNFKTKNNRLLETEDGETFFWNEG